MKPRIPLERHVDPEPSAGWIVLVLFIVVVAGAIYAGMPIAPDR